MAIVIDDVLIAWIIGKLCDGALQKFPRWGLGHKEKRAFKKAISISLDKFKREYPVPFAELFKSKLFKSALEKELSSLLDPNSQVNLETLAKIGKEFSSVPKNELQKCLNRLFEIIKEEIVRQPDLRSIEQIRLLFALEKATSPQTISEIDTRTRIASRKALEQSIAVLCSPNTVIELGSYLSSDNEQPISNKDIIEFLENGHNIIIEAEPGAGKSTTLYQIAKAMLKKDETVFPILLSLPDWSDNKGFLEFVAQTDAFSEQNLSLGNIRSLARHGHLVFFIDGWNELSGEKLKKARININTFQKEYPNSGILIATRAISLPPKLTMGFNVTLNRLDGYKRDEIIRNTVGDKEADELIALIDDKTALRQIAQTPFYLDILLSVYQCDGFLPETKEALLSKCTHINDDKEELIEELNGCHHKYMTALSVEMFGVGTTRLGNDSACKTIASVSQNLIDAGKFTSPPDPPKILDFLAKYHLLINRKGGKSWQFQHQQFQEWYASRWVEKLLTLSSDGRADSLKELREEVLNIPRWEEALFFSIERLAGQEGQQDKLAMVVINALEVDPLLSAEIIALSDKAVWSLVKDTVLEYVDKWHKPEKIDRSLTFMIASGRPEFSDKLWPLITHENHQDRLHALSVYKPFRFNCLGDMWQKKLEGYSEGIRDDILSQIAHYGGIEGLDIATEAAIEDPSAKIKKSVLEEAYFRNSPTHLQRIIENASPEVSRFYHRLLIPEEMNEQTKAQAIVFVREDLDSTTKNINRLNIYLKLWKLGVEEIKNELFETLEHLEEDMNPGWGFYELIEQVSKIDETRTANILINRAIQMGELNRQAEEFTSYADKEHRQKLVRYFLDKNSVFRDRLQVSGLFQKEEIFLILKKLLVIYNEIYPLPKHNVPKKLIERKRYLEGVLKNTHEQSFVEALIQLNGSRWEIAFVQIKGFCRSLFTGNNENNSTLLKVNHIAQLSGILAWPENRQGDQPDSHRLELPDDLSDSFRSVLRNWTDILRSSDNGFGHRHELSEISMVLGRIGNEDDISLINDLLQYDLGYRNNLQQEWERKGMCGQRPNGLIMSFTNLYRRAFEAMPHRKVVEEVAPYLNDSEFCKEAAYIIRHAWFVENGLLSHDSGWSNNSDFSKVSENMKKLENQERDDPHPYAENVLNRIEELLPQQEDKKVRGMIFDLSAAITDTEYGHRISTIEQVIGLEGLGKFACLIKLIQKGEKISADIIKPCCETIRQEWEEVNCKKTDDWYRVGQWLELLVLSDDPMQIMDLVKGLPEYMQEERTFDRILKGLRYSPSEDAEKTLLALVEAFPELVKNGDWLKAMHDQLTEASYQFFYKILWDSNKAQHFANPTSWSHAPFVNIIEKIIRANPDIRRDFIDKLETPLAHQLSRIIGLVVQQLGDDEEITQASLLLLRNGGLMPYGIENYVTRREPIDGSSNIFNIAPSSAVEMRKKLLEMTVNDPQRNEAAKHVLASIDELRDEHGRPENEPRHPCLESGVPWPISI
ncbi:MAG: hypothetical protein ACI9N1_002292 [Flavobacteriales bacterium]|jgi:hypothetical protein